jgi:hypothetical protein
MNEELENSLAEVTAPEITDPPPAEPVLFDDDDQDSDVIDAGAPPAEEGAPAKPAESRTFVEMRKNFKGALSDKKRLEKELAELREKLPKPEPALTAKPTLDQFDYDETRFSEAYDKWMEQKEALNRADQAKLDAQRQEQEALANFQKSYAERSKALGVDDFEEAESEVGAMLNQMQTGLLMRGADDPANLVYALSKSPARLMDLAKITDPVKFTVAIARMELSLATKKTTRPAPEPRLTSERTGTGFNASSATLEKLRDEAARTGDFTKVVEYKRKMAQGSK